jgi:hypothetical protein
MSIDLATATRDVFEAQRGSRFRLHADGRVIDLELIATEPLPSPPGARRGAFLVRFRAGEPGHVPQRIYALEHATLGRLELFIVPVGPDAVGMRYDAIFS